MAPQTITDCGNFTLTSATWILCLSFLPPDSGTLISKGMQNLLSSENITLDHSAAVQSFLSLAQARRFWSCLLFKSGFDTRNATAETHVLHTSVRSGSWSTGLQLQSTLCESPPHFWMGFVSQSSPGCGYPIACTLFFYHIFSFPSPLY